MRRRRVALGVSTARLAEEIGVRPSEISRWERGDTTPPPTRIRAMARVLGLDQATMLSWIAGAGDFEPSAADVEHVDITIDLAPPDPFVVITDRSRTVAVSVTRNPPKKPQSVAVRPILRPPTGCVGVSRTDDVTRGRPPCVLARRRVPPRDASTSDLHRADDSRRRRTHRARSHVQVGARPTRERLRRPARSFSGDPADSGCRISDVGYRMSDIGCRMPDIGCRISDAGYRMPDNGCRITDAGYRRFLSVIRYPSCPVSIPDIWDLP